MAPGKAALSETFVNQSPDSTLITGVPRAGPPSIAPDELLANRYRTRHRIGKGGMGQVWLAEDTIKGRQVALKVLRRAKRSSGSDSDAGEAGREYYTLRKLQHPNTLEVYDFGFLDTGERYISMELVEGRDLHELIGEKGMSAPQIYGHLVNIARVLHFIHSRLFVHCDVKADNIRISNPGVLKLMDFGLMHAMGTPATHVMGTPTYMAPEIALGGVIDARTDLYSVGCLAFLMATGRMPFEGETLNELITQHIAAPPPKVSALRPDLPAGLSGLIAVCLEKAPNDRFADMAEFLVELGRISGQSIDRPASLAHRVSYLRSVDMVGRGVERNFLRTALTSVLSAESKSVLVGGPPGVGKTRLLQEFRLAAEVKGIPFLSAQCRAEGQAPLEPLVELLS